MCAMQIVDSAVLLQSTSGAHSRLICMDISWLGPADLAAYYVPAALRVSENYLHPTPRAII